MADGDEKNIVLVTGGTGLVGYAIKELVEQAQLNGALNTDNYKFIFISSKDANLTKREEAEAIFRIHKPSNVINLAAKVGGLYANMRENEIFYKDNMAINENVIRLSHEHKVKKCISCLSTCIFPDKIEYPFDESKIHCGPPNETNSGYSSAKRQVDLLNREYHAKANGDTLFTAVIPTNIYGKNDNYNLDQAHVVPSLIHKSYLAISNKQSTIEVCGSGKPLRQFILATDLARLILWTLEHYNEVDPIIIAPDDGDELSIGDVASYIVKSFHDKLDSRLQINFNPFQYNDGQFRKTASNRKLRLYLPDFKFTKFEDGIVGAINWFCDKYPDIRK